MPTLKSASRMNGVGDGSCGRAGECTSLASQRAAEAAIAYEHGADVGALMPKLRHSDYFTEPRICELAAKECLNPGYCRMVNDFVVGRRAFGSVRFLGSTDVRRLDLDSIIQFNKCEILVYMDATRKPPNGQGLNKPAEAILLNVRCVDKKTGHYCTHGPEVEAFEKRLRKKTEEQGAEFVSYDACKGEWRFQVKHFSRYGLDDSDDEDTLQSDPGKALVVAGMDMMDGVEEDMVDDSTELGEDVEDIGKFDSQIGVFQNSAQSALPHSLPYLLRLDPEKMQQMKALFSPLGDMTGPPLSIQSSKSYSTNSRQVKLITNGGAIDKSQDRIGNGGFRSVRSRSPWKGGQTKQTRFAPHTFWNQPTLYLPTNHSRQGSDAMSLPTAIVSLHSNDVTGSKQHKNDGFIVEFNGTSESIVAGQYDRIVDAGLFFGRSFRVGWGPNGVLVHSGFPVGSDIKNSALTSNLNIEKAALDNTVRDGEGNVLEELVELQYVSPLKIHMSMSKSVESQEQLTSGDLRLWNVVCAQSDLSVICDEYEDLIHKQHGVIGLLHEYQVALQHEVTVWQLLQVLFANMSLAQDSDEQKENTERFTKWTAATNFAEPMELLSRRAEFSRWLQRSVSHLVQDDLENLDEDDVMKEVFFMLTGRKVDSAVMKASLIGDVRLACLLSEAGASVRNRSDLEKQLSGWETGGFEYALIDEGRMTLYKLLAGDVLGALNNHEIDWKRFLGLIMWYQLAPDADLSVIISTYHQFVNDEKFLPIPMYLEEGHESNLSQVQVYDTAYYFMLLYASKPEEVPREDVKRMFSPASTTFDRLDHRMAWHQRGLLQALGVLEPVELYDLDMSFVAQLLAVGLCHWAIYVVLHMPVASEYPGLHESVIKEILSSYCGTWSKSESQQQFLEQELGIPAKWLDEALALYFQYVGDSKLELVHLIKSWQWHQAQVLFMTAVSASMFISLEHSEVWKFASQLQMHNAELENWELGGGIFLEFYNLKFSFSNEDTATEDTLERKTINCKAFFTGLKASERVWTSNTLRSAYSQMADELAGLLLLETNAKAQTTVEELNVHDAILDAPVSEYIHSCSIQGAASAFNTWLSEQEC